MSSRTIRCALAAGACAAALCARGEATAQSAVDAAGANSPPLTRGQPDPPPAVTQNQVASGQLSEIVVTAQKRQQNAIDVPITMTAYTGAFLDKLNVRDFHDLSQFTPGFNAPPRDLHDVWDGAADLPGSEAQGADALAARLEGGGLAPETAAPLRHGCDAAFRTWWQESYALAVSTAYAGDALKETPTPAGAPVLSAAYQDRARQIAERRIRLGGLRIAASLAAALS